MNRPRLLLASLGSLAVLACRTTEVLEPASAAVLASAEPLRVTLAPNLVGWKETPSSPGKPTRFRLGPLFTHLFPAHDGRAFLSPVEASLESHWNPQNHSWESRYAFTLTLQLDGVHHPIRAVGRGRDALGPRPAERQALEACVSEIHARAAEILGARDGS